ncbi:hypothetical protein NHG95_16910 [Pseudomonas corrugata]|uniref:hypothetical protein n=2 Tax=Pseudomonas corrugata TaxID=47879 RepID=UPI0028C40C54|nr:hypothetical protein [Pseudomonas corrugata]MDU9034828.1 hypothetical protein [Pseudomonas corrugata]
MEAPKKSEKDVLLTHSSSLFSPPPLFRRFFQFRRGALPWVNYRQSEASKVTGKSPQANCLRQSPLDSLGLFPGGEIGGQPGPHK